LLAHSYARRKQFEARLIAVEVAKMLTGATGSTPHPAGAAAGAPAVRTVTRTGKAMDRVPARALLDQLGARLDF
jgi:hypothetical protein